MFDHISKHLEVHGKYPAARRIYLFSVFGYPDETMSLVFDILHQVRLRKLNAKKRLQFVVILPLRSVFRIIVCLTKHTVICYVLAKTCRKSTSTLLHFGGEREATFSEQL